MTAHHLSRTPPRPRPLVSTPILYPRLRELLHEGAQLVEVLPEQEFADAHLPGAINLRASA
jgi:rhodanese-related sulfurtransferase